jgi:trehalose 6-phosphate synthase/phosphatase
VKLPGSGWGQAAAYADEWKADIRRSLQQSVDAMPGSFIEEKATALVWHYRNANAQLSGREALHLIDRLSKLAAEYNIQIVPGNTIVEVREAGVDKGQAATHLLGQDNWDFVFAAGDDTTDEDMFKALPNATTVKVGSGDTQAKNRVRNPDELLGLLEGLA